MSTEEDSTSRNNSMPSCSTSTSLPVVLPIRMISRVSKGFGRGSKDLGIPTANLDRATLQSSTSFDDLPTGIYWGYGRIVENGGDSGEGETKKEQEPAAIVYTAAISIGYNPTYGNSEKSCEPHLIAAASDPRRHASSTGETLMDDFYERTCRLSVIGYLRPELPFEGLDKLVEAIKKDIVNAEQLGAATADDASDPVALKEKQWVGSSGAVV